jgi:hypothetical protein
MGGDGPMGRDQSGGGGKGLGFGTGQVGLRAEIGEGIGLRMNLGRSVESGLKLGEGPAIHEDIEGSSAEVAGFPEMGQQGLGNDEVAGFGIEAAGELRGQLLLGVEKEALSNRTLCRQATLEK